jgi:hypothetical protein
MASPLDEQPINWGGFSQNQSGVVFPVRNGTCSVFVPTYKNVSNVPVASGGTNMVFQDEWSTHAFLATGDTTKIDGVLLEDLYQYASNNILWNKFTQQLSFQDSQVQEVTLESFVANLDNFLVYHKLSKFGNVWWTGRVTSDMANQNTAFANVFVPNISGFFGTGATQQVSFWSPDKHLNDEYKKYNANQSAYSGFFTSADFTTGGWFTIPDLTLSTNPFENLKIAQVLLNLNFTFDPVARFGTYYATDSTMSSRIKDETSGAILDVSQTKAAQNGSTYTDSMINHWIGGLVSTSNIQNLGTVGTPLVNTCSPPPAPTPTEISHLIEAQITLNDNYTSNNIDQFGAIDPINWRSAENTPNAHTIGVLNTSRSFGGANGTIDSGLVFGGINTALGQGSTVLDTVEVWSGDGFLKNVQTQANSPRCFHVQGGFGGTSLAALGGYTTFNTDDYIQFGDYGKAGVRSDLEMFVQSDDPTLSYFTVVPNFSLSVGRGDAAGALTVSTVDNQDKFEATTALEGFQSSKNDQQTIAEFINDQSGINNFTRYMVANINGFIYGGSSTGNVYMSTTAGNDVLSSFENISTVFIDAGTTDEALITPTNNQPEGACQSIVQDVVTIPGNSATGVTLSVTACGKYRLTYLNGGAQRGAPVQNSGGGHHGLFSSISSALSLPGLPSLETVAGEIAALGPVPNPPEILGLSPLPPLPLDLFGTQTAVLGNNPYSIRLRVYVNQIKINDLAFSVPDQNTVTEIESYLQAHPSFQTFDFCVPYQNSTITLIFDTVNPAAASGFINYQLCTLGEIDGCSCPSETLPSITNVAISYSTVNPNLTYPVPAHGMCFVGTNSSGISTGGRCENNTLSQVEVALLNKYSTGYQVQVDLAESLPELESFRVLDLVYQYDGTAWTRKQNLIESVYYHTGVGDDSHSIFWGGIHDTISDYSFSYSNEVSAAPTPDFNQWNCANKIIKQVTENTTDGVGYVPELSGSACWQAPNWASVSHSLLFDNPLFVNEVDAPFVQYARDIHFPAITFTSLYPNDSTTFAQQTYNALDFNFTVSSLDISASIATNSSFEVQASTVQGDSTIIGTWTLANLELVFNEASTIYPANISAGTIRNEVKTLTITEVDANTDSVDFAYNLSHFFNYTDSMTFNTSAAGVRGVGSFSFNSLNDMWTQGISGNEVIQTPVNTMLIVSSSADTSAAFYISGYANAYFQMADAEGVMIGVGTTKDTWAGTMENCGSDITSFLNIDAQFGTDHEQRWGVPLWNSAFDHSANLFLMYDFNSRVTLSDGNFSTDDYQITSVSASAASVAAIVNNRILIKGNTHEQLHMAQAINGASVPAVSSNCQTVIPEFMVSFTTPSSGSCYSEWASSFVQEYNSNSIYTIPQVWNFSNGLGVTSPSSGIIYASSSWRRYMDGVGLGGDAPDYDSIVNPITKIKNPCALWSQINKWHIGQMAFGTTSQAVIVGGHKVDRTAGQTLVGSGLHADPTTSRVFVWDFTTIPEEDSFLTNYLGRRFFTYAENDSNTPPITSNNTMSDLNCIVYDAASDIIVEQHGTATFDGTSQTVQVTFDTPFGSNVGTNYSIGLTPNDSVKLWWTNKTMGGFTLNIAVSSWAGNVDYLATATTQVTEQDISNLGPLQGYIFEG